MKNCLSIKNLINCALLGAAFSIAGVGKVAGMKNCPPEMSDQLSNPDELDERRDALMTCCYNSDLESARSILKIRGFDPNYTEGRSSWKSPLGVAVFNVCLPLVSLLIEHGANVNPDSGYTTNPLYLAVMASDPSRGHDLGEVQLVVQFLIDKGADVNNGPSGCVAMDGTVVPLCKPYRPLFGAIKMKCVELIVLLLENGAHMSNDTLDEYGRTAVIAAIDTNSLPCLQHLFEIGQKQRGIAAELLANAFDKDGKSALTYAVEMNYLDMVDSLIKYGADVNKVTGRDGPALFTAAAQGYYDMVVLLLENRADPKVRNYDGCLAETVAKVNGHNEIYNLLRSRTAEKSGCYI